MRITCRFFRIYELVPRSIYDRFPPDLLWKLFDDRLLLTADRIRIRYNRIVYINDWYWGGIFEESGFRHFDSNTGAKLSDHKFGRALDLKVEGMSHEEIRQDIRLKPNIKAFKYITAVELGVSWLHIATANWNKKKDGIYFFTPSSQS